MTDKTLDLILWRHADAEQGLVDHARGLTRKGRGQAKRVATWLRKRALRRPRVLVSPAVRAQQTAQAFAARFETTSKLDTGTPARELLAAAGWPHARGAVIVVGHQPELGRAAALAVTGRAADWNIRKGALWWIRRKAGNGITVVAVISPDFL